MPDRSDLIEFFIVILHCFVLISPIGWAYQTIKLHQIEQGGCDAPSEQ